MTQMKAYTSLKRVKWVGKDQFVIHKRELLQSHSWKTMSINCFRLISFLELRYLENAGEENGYYVATYNQLFNYGIRKKSIKKTIEEAQKLCLIRYSISENVGMYGKFTYLFRLTYLPQTIKNGEKRYYLPPSNEWKYIQKAGGDCAPNISGDCAPNETEKTDKKHDSIRGDCGTIIYI